ncbi:MAG TPA: ion channel [Steroidobacteraceae bacterium]|nr:ion channel [Steroidobacteraceae bacterium]
MAISKQPRERSARVRLGRFEIKKIGISRFDLRDPYHLAVALTWPGYLWALLALYVSANLLFAVLFWAVPGSIVNARPHSFADAFFFSIETIGTVGYGDMHPATLYGHFIASIEIVCGLAFTAILTGLTFVRFSRPRAKLVFAANPVIVMHNSKPTLMLLVGNGRPGVLTDATAKLNVSLAETAADGTVLHRAQELRVQRAHIPLFPLSWTLMHVLDEKSPLHGYDAARVLRAQVRIFVTLEARDPTLATSVHDMRIYSPEDIRFGVRYRDPIAFGDDGPVLNLTTIGTLEPDVGDRHETGWTEREEGWG